MFVIKPQPMRSIVRVRIGELTYIEKRRNQRSLLGRYHDRQPQTYGSDKIRRGSHLITAF